MGWRRPRGISGLDPGEKVLAATTGPGGDIVATTHRLLLPGPPETEPETGVAWSQIDTATWDGDDRVLMVSEIPDETGDQRRHRVVVDEPDPLVDVVRERVTASVVISRRIPIKGHRGVRVTGRRTARDELMWSVLLDPGVNIDDPDTRNRVNDAVALVRSEVE
jgi:hypothetical protein